MHDPRNIEYGKIETAFLENRVARVVSEETFARLANIDDAIFQATVEYFSNIGSKWTNLPLTTLMISSPGEVYAGQTLDYTTDTLPVEIPDWF
ncbi:MAG: asparaginyl-tRNA synthetase [Patescibacteria group bacterium]|nr:asparaginyl-tRNA synthetase [Patescibacteria group bacterium]